VQRHPDGDLRAEESAGADRVHGVPAEVEPVGGRRQRDVGAPVDDEAHGAPRPPGGGPRGGADAVAELEQRRALQGPLADLHPVDPGGHGSAHDGRGISPQRRTVDDQTEDGQVGVDQKLASPSRGLDADA
jgi:hypothetical protein